MAASVSAGLLPRRAVVVWPAGSDAGADGDPRGALTTPPGLELEHHRETPGSPGLVADVPGVGRVLLLAGDLLLGPGALAAWLRDGADTPARPGVAAIAGTDPLLAGATADALAARLAASPELPSSGPTDAEHLWMRARGPADVARGERRLFASLGKASDGVAARLLNRPISTRVSRRLARLRTHPSLWTGILVILTASSAAVLMRGDPLGFVAGAVLFNLISILDGCDGELARVQYRESARGARLDTLSDMLSHHVFVLALGIGLARQPRLADPWPATYFTEGVLAATGIALALWGAAAVERSWQQGGHFRDFGISVLDSSGLTGMKRRIGKAISDLARQDTYHWLWIPVALAGWPAWILHVFAAGVAAHLAALAYVWVKGRHGAPVPTTSQP